MVWLVYENQDESGEMETTLEGSDNSEGLPSGETGGEAETSEGVPSQNTETNTETNESETVESIDYTEQFQQIISNQEQTYSMLNACCIFLALGVGITIIFEFFRGVTR